MIQPTLKLFYSPGACSLAPHIALEEAGAAFEPVLTSLAAGAQKTPEYLALNPKGRVPALADGDFVLTENPAVLRYIALKFPQARLWPEDAYEDARCTEWLGWCTSGLHIAYAHVRRAERYADSDGAKAEVIRKGIETARVTWEQVERRLARAGTEWAAGENFSVADPYLLVFWLWGRGPTLGYDMARDFPAWTRIAKRLAARPAVLRALGREDTAPP
jgi:glutathione S-transferase